MKSLLLSVAGVLLLAAAARAQCPPNRTFDALEPTATDTYAVRFVGRTLTGIEAVTVTARRTLRTDANPAGLVAASTTAGDTVFLRIVANAGSIDRAGNVYQLTVQPIDADNNKPTANVCLTIKKVLYQP